MELGIIGLPKSGKTTVFNALTRGRAETSPYSQTPGKPNLGVAKVPDPRLDTLAAMFHPERVVHAEVRYVDVRGAPEGLGEHQGIGDEYLNILQRTDALLHVVRTFDDPSVPHGEGGVDPYRDTATMNLELAFSDLAILERRSQRLEAELKGAKTQERERIRREATLLERLKEGLAQEIPVRVQELTAEEQRLISAYQFLTAKPLLILINIGEGQLAQTRTLEEAMGQRLDGPGVKSAAMCAGLEAELSQMEGQDDPPLIRTAGAHLLLHHRVPRGESMDRFTGHAGSKSSRTHPLRYGAGIHPRRGGPLRRPCALWQPRRGTPPRSPASGGPQLPGQRRRRRYLPVQRMSVHPEDS